MSNIAELFNTLAIKAGIASDNEHLKNVLSAPDLQKVIIPEELSDKLQAGLLNIESAKNNYEVIKSIKANTLSGVDKNVHELLDEFGLEDDFKAEIKGNKNSFEKVTALARKLNELKEAKKDASTKGEKDSLQAEINKLNNEIKTAKATFDTEKNNLISNHEKQLLDLSIENKLASISYALPEDMPMETKIKTAYNVLFADLAKANIKPVKKDGEIKLFRTDLEGEIEYHDATNTKIGFDDFFKKSLATNKLLKVTETPPAGTPPVTTPITTPGGKTAVGTSSINNSIDQAIADLMPSL